MSWILLVEDEANLAEGLVFNLMNAGYHVEHVDNGEAALEAVEKREFELLLLDVMLPGIDGLEVARRIRKTGRRLPILMISARDRTADAIGGIDSGADDYITKPFDLDEVLARIRAALRRQVWNRAESGGEPRSVLQYGRWRIDFGTYEARASDGSELALSAKEIAMLELFGQRSGEVISRETFLEEVWGLRGTLETRTVDNYVRKLRLALEDDPSNPRHILSVRGAGYRFVP